jgi:hypothetical protein
MTGANAFRPQTFLVSVAQGVPSKLNSILK